MSLKKIDCVMMKVASLMRTIFSSGMSIDDMRAKASESPYIWYIAKPWGLEEIFAIVKRAEPPFGAPFRRTSLVVL